MTKPGETRGTPRKLSLALLAERTGHPDALRAGYVKVSYETVKAAEDPRRERPPTTETLAALYHALDATPEEFPAGAIAEASYLMARWLVESDVDVETALARRAKILRLLGREDDPPPPAMPGELGPPPGDSPPSFGTRERQPPRPEGDAP